MSDKKRDGSWDKKSRNESNRNYVLGGRGMGNPSNNTDNPNWRNQMTNTGYRNSMLNDPQRVEESNVVDDNNGNKETLKEYPINPS